MFIVTAKFSKRKALCIVLALAIVIGAIIFFAGRNGSANEGTLPEAQIETPEDVAAFLESLGWQVSQQPLEVQEILIPRSFSDVYLAYNELQIKAGFDLTAWHGMDAVRFTFAIENYPDHPTGIVADVLVADQKIIGGNIQATQLDGFMHELRANENAPDEREESEENTDSEHEELSH